MGIKTLKRKVRHLLNGLYYNYFDYTVKNYYVILNFHQVTEKFDPKYHIKGTWTDIGLFEDTIQQLKQEFQIIPLKEGINLVNSHKLKGKLLSITFDDGDKSISNVIPILKKYSAPATFFINTAYLSNNTYSYQVLRYFNSFIGSEKNSEINFLLENSAKFRNTNDTDFYNKYRNTFLYFRNNLKDEIDFVIDEKILTSLDPTLFTIGLHGHEHERFGMMDNEWQLNDLRKNISILSSYKAFTPIFAVPFGRPWDWNDYTIKISLDLKLELLFHDFGINYKKEIGFKRIPADGKKINQILYYSLLR